MRTVKFLFEKIPQTNLIKYPENISHFSNAETHGEYLIVDYVGSLDLPAGVRPEKKETTSGVKTGEEIK